MTKQKKPAEAAKSTVALLTRRTLAAISPAHPESAKTASSPRDTPFPGVLLTACV